MARFLVPPSALRGRSFVLSGSEAHHALHVLRKKAGDEIDLFDGKEASYKGRIDSVAGDEIRGTLLEERSPLNLPVQITLYQALLRGSKWEWMLEKSGEIGVTRVIPIITRRTLIKLDAARAREKVKRWNRIALAASKQSGRSDLMSIGAPMAFADAVAALKPSTLSLIPWEKEIEKTIRDACKSYPSPQPSSARGEGVFNRSPLPRAGEGQGEGGIQVNLFIGPEGGWDPSEVDTARRAGAVPVRLGPTLLRTETAGLIAAALVLREFGVY